MVRVDTEYGQIKTAALYAPRFVLPIGPIMIGNKSNETYLAAQGLAAQGLAAQGFFAAQGLAAQGFFAAQGLAAQGFFAAQGLAAQGLQAANWTP